MAKIRKAETPETEFKALAVKVLLANGFVVMRVNSDSRNYKVKSYHIFERGMQGDKGFPDLIAFQKPNKCMLIETKAGRNGLNDAQKGFKAFLETKGFTNFKVCSTIDELTTIIKESGNV
jgi:hypothetical protein